MGRHKKGGDVAVRQAQAYEGSGSDSEDEFVDRRSVVRTAVAAPSDSEDDLADRRSVVRTGLSPAVVAQAEERDFGIGNLRASASRRYLRKKSGVAWDKKKKHQRVLSSTRKASAKEKAKEKALSLPDDAAMWVKFGLPLLLLLAVEGLRFAVGSDGDGNSPGAAPDAGLDPVVMVGVGLSVAASLLNAMGLNLQRLGQNANAKAKANAGTDADADADADGNGDGKKKKKKKSKKELQSANLNKVGVLLSALAGLVDLISFSFAPQSMLAPFGAVTLIANLGLAPLLHNEALSGTDVAATSLVVLGIAVSLGFSAGAASSPHHSLRDLERLASRPVFQLYIALYLAGIASLISHLVLGEGQGRGMTKEVAVAYPLLSGMLGGLTTLNAKLMTELLKIVGITSHPHLLVPVMAMVGVCAVAQTAVLNRGLGKHSSLFVVPLFSASFLVCNLLGGGIFFDEFSNFESSQLAGFLVGVALVVVGVTTLATKEEEEGHGDDGARKAKKKSS